MGGGWCFISTRLKAQDCATLKEKIMRRIQVWPDQTISQGKDGHLWNGLLSWEGYQRRSVCIFGAWW